MKNILGMVIAVIGMVVYSWAVEVEKRADSKIIPRKDNLSEENSQLLKVGKEESPAKDVELGKCVG